MINKRHFLTKNGKPGKNSYCDTPELIKNYDEAVNDTENMWVCHHKLEAFFTMEELKGMGRYYHVPPRELIFLKTEKDHAFWPHKGRLESIEKNRQAHLGKYNHDKNPFYGKHHTEETKEKLRKKVRCLETGKIFNSLGEAAKWCNLKSVGKITECCKGTREKAGGYHWNYA